MLPLSLTDIIELSKNCLRLKIRSNRIAILLGLVKLILTTIPEKNTFQNIYNFEETLRNWENPEPIVYFRNKLIFYI